MRWEVGSIKESVGVLTRRNQEVATDGDRVEGKMASWMGRERGEYSLCREDQYVNE